QFAYSDVDGNISIRRVADGKVTAHLAGPKSAPEWVVLRFTPNGGRLVVRYQYPAGDEVQVWEFQDGQAARPVILEGGRVFHDASRDGRLLAVSGKDGRVATYDVATGREVKRLQQAAAHAAFHPDGRHLGLTIESLALVVDLDTGLEVARYVHSHRTGT